MKKALIIGAMAMLAAGTTNAQSKHSFALSKKEFLLDGKPYQIISGEMHPARIPKEYWRQRIQMAKAMGCNTIAAYVFWNYHEEKEGQFDFTTENRDIAQFIKIAQEEGMWVMLRPGPYVCAEWDFGGLPPYLLKIPDIKVRCLDPRYMAAVERYVKALSDQVRPLLVKNGGPILMVQVENEYGSYSNDKQYLETLRNIWVKNGVDGPFYTADGPSDAALEAGHIPGAVVGLDSGDSEGAFAAASRADSTVPSFSSESYPGWLTHWGEKFAHPDKAGILKEVKFLLDTHRSFNMYVVHGGTNFGFTAGANNGGKGYEPDLTSYDYDAPVNEQGVATEKYMALRELIGSYSKKKLPAIPAAIPAIQIPSFQLAPFSNVWQQLPAAQPFIQPVTFETVGLNNGFMVYKTVLIGHKHGKLDIKELHDYATVFLNGKYVGKIDRRLGEHSIELPKSDVKDPVLEILVEGMGRINYGADLIDRKGITDRVTLNGMTLTHWEQYSLPMDGDYLGKLPQSGDTSRPGIFFKGSFNLTNTGDTYIDLSAFKKGVVWVNGHNLGRYWEIGPQKRLYCPAPWLKKGENEILVFDQHQTQAASVSGEKTLE